MGHRHKPSPYRLGMAQLDVTAFLKVSGALNGASGAQLQPGIFTQDGNTWTAALMTLPQPQQGNNTTIFMAAQAQGNTPNAAMLVLFQKVTGQLLSQAASTANEAAITAATIATAVSAIQSSIGTPTGPATGGVATATQQPVGVSVPPGFEHLIKP
jgi:hypothetical protein